jgi:predicted O-methyltransferase YrrM
MSRAFRHLTPRYVVNKLRYLHNLRRHPDQPWLTRQANEMLSSLILPTDVGLEFGSGRSTLWLARRMRHMTSVEHDSTWHEQVARTLAQNGISNVEYLFREQDTDDDRAHESGYVRVANAMPEQSLDFVLVDGIYRVDCANAVLDRLRPGGLLILDDAQRYLPSNSVSPDARQPDQGPLSRKWSTFLEAVHGWRTIWTSSGIDDTAIWFKPAAGNRQEASRR